MTSQNSVPTWQLTGYELDGPGIESRWGEIFITCPDGPWTHPASCKLGIGSFPGVNSGRGVTLTPHSLLLPWSWKGRAIPLLPLWAVRPVQSLSACTGVTFTFQLFYLFQTPCCWMSAILCLFQLANRPPFGWLVISKMVNVIVPDITH